MDVFEKTRGEGSFAVSLSVSDTGRGLACLLTGGDSPHIGSVVLAIPRASLSGEGASCDIYTIPVPGHLDYVVAQEVASALCKARQVPVSVSAGIHIDGASQADIARIEETCRQLADDFLEA